MSYENILKYFFHIFLVYFSKKTGTLCEKTVSARDKILLVTRLYLQLITVDGKYLVKLMIV